MQLAIILGIEEFAEKVGSLITDGIALINEGLSNSLGTTLIEMLIQLCCTLVIFLIVRFKIWNVVTNILEQRKKAVRDALAERDEAIKERDLAKQEAIDLKRNSQIEGAKIVESAKKKGYQEANLIIDNANEQAKLKINNASEEIERMKNEASEDIKREIVDIAYLMASKIVDKEISKDDKDSLITEFLKENK